MDILVGRVVIIAYQVLATQPSPVLILIHHNRLDNVRYFKFG